MHAHERATTSSTASPAAQPRGVRRHREESIEIEELDSDTMRQNTYNYFQRYTRTSAPTYNANGFIGSENSSSGAAFALLSGAYASPSGSARKRQRTLADRLEELCIGSGSSYVGRSSSARQTTTTRPDAAMADSDQSDSGATNGDDDNSSSDGETDRASRRNEQLLVYGGGSGSTSSSMRGFFFGATRRRPMDRVFRHYAAVASQTASDATGNELVVYRRTRAPAVSPLSTLTPLELEMLTRHEARKRNAVQRTSSSDSSTELPVSVDDGSDDLSDDVDMDGSYMMRRPVPHASGELSHGEWFLSDSEEL